MGKKECTNEWCDNGVVSISYGEKLFCGICEGSGFIDAETATETKCNLDNYEDFLIVESKCI
jgi:hypothetical protein